MRCISGRWCWRSYIRYFLLFYKKLFGKEEEEYGTETWKKKEIKILLPTIYLQNRTVDSLNSHINASSSSSLVLLMLLLILSNSFPFHHFWILFVSSLYFAIYQNEIPTIHLVQVHHQFSFVRSSIILLSFFSYYCGSISINNSDGDGYDAVLLCYCYRLGCCCWRDLNTFHIY